MRYRRQSLYSSNTKDAVFAVKNLIERLIEVQKDLYLCFKDYNKAWEKLKHDELLHLLGDMGLDERDLRIQQNMYYQQSAKVHSGQMVRKSKHCSTLPSQKAGSTALNWTKKKQKSWSLPKKEDPPNPVILAGYTRRENFDKFKNLGTTFNWNAKSDSKSLWPKLSTIGKSILRQKSLSFDVRRKILVAYVFAFATQQQSSWKTERDFHVTISRKCQSSYSDNPRPPKMESVYKCGRQCLEFFRQLKKKNKKNVFNLRQVNQK